MLAAVADFSGCDGLTFGHGPERVRVDRMGGAPKGSGDAEGAALLLGLAWGPLDPQKDHVGLA